MSVNLNALAAAVKAVELGRLGRYSERPLNVELHDAIEAYLIALPPISVITHHASDCAVHNEPAMPNGPCDCSMSSVEQNLGEQNDKS